MLLSTYKGFEIRMAQQTGGKAGKDCNRTTTLQVFQQGGNTMRKAFRFTKGDAESAKSAARKARKYIDEISQ